MKVSSKRAVHLGGALALACLSFPFVGVGAAYADTATLAPSNSAYFSATGIVKPDPAPQAPPNVVSDYADGVEPGHLAVASRGGNEDKVSFVYFDLLNLPTDATVNSAVVTMQLKTDGNNLNFNASPAAVQACPSGPTGFAGDDGVGIASAPARLCTDFSVKGTATADAKAYQWDITKLAQTWVAGMNDGLAFTRADAASGSNFQVVFGKADTAKLALTYTPKAAVVTPPPPVVAPPVAQPAPMPAPNPGVFVPSGPIDFGVTPEVTVPNPTVNQQPQVVIPVGESRAVPLSTSLRPTNAFWLAAFALVGALALVSLVMGDGAVPVTVAGRRSRLSAALASPSQLATMSMARPRPV